MKLALFVLALVGQRWLFVSDIHLDRFSHDSYTYSGHDTTNSLWKSSLDAMHARVPDPSVVVIGGDLLAHHFETLARKAGADPETAAIATVREVAGDLARLYPHAQFLVTLGNNDDPCGDYRSEIGGSYQNALAKIWEPLVNRGGSAPDFAVRFVHGGYYSVRLPRAGERALVLNSVLWSFVYRGSCTRAPRNPGASELTWLARALAHSGSGRNVLVMHVPMGYDPQSTADTHRVVAVPFLNGGANRSLLGLINDYRADIAFALAAHTHRYAFRVASGVPVLVGSSISPIYRNSPAFFELGVDSAGQLHDVVPYFYDLQEDSWQKAPSFDTMYGVDGFSAENLSAISERIARDPAVRASWISAYDVWAYRMGDVLDHPWRVFWCAQTQQDGRYAACAGTQNRFAGLLIVGAIAALAVVLAVVVATRRFFIVRR